MKRCCLLLIVFLLAVSGCQADSESGQQTLGSSSQAIVDGQVSAVGAHPATVLLLTGGGMCTGTLISPQVVLTARHCVNGATRIQVVVGNDPQAPTSVTYEADSWDIDSVTDMGAITLIDPVMDVDPIAIYRTAPQLGTEVTIVGFGETQGAGGAGIKREGVTVVEELQGDIMLIGNEPSGTCFGDSGGPAFIDEGGTRYVAGVTSFGSSDDCRAGVSGDVRTDTRQTWIDEYVTANDACAENGFCAVGCPVVDRDCCGMADGECIPGCAVADPDCASVGGDCVGNSECDSDLCATVGDESLCSQTCSAEVSCPDGFECRDGVACWPIGGGGCRAGGSGGGPFAVVLAVMLLFARRRRSSPRG